MLVLLPVAVQIDKADAYRSMPMAYGCMIMSSK